MADSSTPTSSSENTVEAVPRETGTEAYIGSDIGARVREKKESYRRYNFERVQEEAFATFFDLAQEYTKLESLYQICVAVPKEFVGLDSRLYLINSKTGRLEMVCTSEGGLIPAEQRTASSLHLAEIPYETDDSCVFPIRGNLALRTFLPLFAESQILGLFEIHPKNGVDEREHLFLEKFTNRIGYNLHQKMLIEQNINHIKFINQLVADIAHNVISPNLYYKLFLIRLRKNIVSCDQAQHRLEAVLDEMMDQEDDAVSTELCEIHELIEKTTRNLEEDRKALAKHYEHTSLFLETLLRRDHFEKGTYVLKIQSCNFRTEIVQPLLERYLPMFSKKGIKVDNRMANVPDEQVTLSVDKGLISQVFDNFFSNALKYTREIVDQLGHPIKFVSYNREILKDFFGEGIDGVRFNFFTTGVPLSEEDSRRIFEEGYRSADAGKERGTGHGMHFIKTVVEIHGGVSGCEPQSYGNLMYFVLPVRRHLQLPE